MLALALSLAVVLSETPRQPKVKQLREEDIPPGTKVKKLEEGEVRVCIRPAPQPSSPPTHSAVRLAWHRCSI
jgi:hypothetical protein